MDETNTRRNMEQSGDTYKRALHTAWQSGGAVFITSVLVSMNKVDLRTLTLSGVTDIGVCGRRSSGT